MQSATQIEVTRLVSELARKLRDGSYTRAEFERCIFARGWSVDYIGRVVMITAGESKHVFSLPRRIGAVEKTVMLVASVAKTVKNSRMDAAEDPSTLFIDLFLPPEHAETAVEDLEELYRDRWLPRHGPRKAKLVFHAQAWGTILSVHWRRIEKVGLAMLAALGLDSVIRIFRKP